MLPFHIAVVPVTPFQQNCTILWDENSKRAAIIDPGGDVPRILRAIHALGVLPERIVLTHGHLDHAGGAATLREQLAVPIDGPDRRDKFLLDSLAAQGEQFGIPGLRDVIPDRWLTEADHVELAGHVFRVLHTPGHTPGHISLIAETARFAFVGDVLFRRSVGRTDFAYGDGVQLLLMIKTKLLPLGDDIAFLCGHGPGSSFGAERADNPYL